MLRSDIIDIPYLPKTVSVKNLKQGKLLSEEEIIAHKTSPEATIRRPIKISKTDKAKRSVILTPDQKLFAIGDPLGAGNMGKVRFIQDQDTLEWGALKITRLQSSDEDASDEFEVLEQLNAASPSPTSSPFFFQRASEKYNGEKSYFSMALKPGKNLLEATRYHVQPITILKIVLNVLKANQELAFQNICHGDVKLENVIADLATGDISLVDLGLFQRIDAEGKSIGQEISGTPKAIAPEMLQAFFMLHTTPSKTVNSIFNIMLTNNMIPLDWTVRAKPIFLAEKTTIYSIGILAAELFKLMGKADIDFIPHPKNDSFIRQLPLSVQGRLFKLVMAMLKPTPEQRSTYAEAIEELTSILNICIKRCDAYPITLIGLNQMPEVSMRSTIIHLCVSETDMRDPQALSLTLAEKKNWLEAKRFIVSRIAYRYNAIDSLRQVVASDYAEMKDRLVINSDKMNSKQQALSLATMASSSTPASSTKKAPR